MQARLPIHVFFAAALALLATPASAEIYKWVDANGVTHFTETRPANGQYQEVKPPPPPANPDAPAQLEQQIQQQSDQDEYRRVQQEEADRVASQRAARQLNCQQATDVIAGLKSRPPYRAAAQDSSGEYARMTAQEYDAKLSKAQALAAEYCRN